MSSLSYKIRQNWADLQAQMWSTSTAALLVRVLQKNTHFPLGRDIKRRETKLSDVAVQYPSRIWETSTVCDDPITWHTCEDTWALGTSVFFRRTVLCPTKRNKKLSNFRGSSCSGVISLTSGEHDAERKTGVESCIPK